MIHVHDTAVDVAKLLEAEQASAMGRVVEDIGLCLESVDVPLMVVVTIKTYGGGVDGNRTSVGRGVRSRAVRGKMSDVAGCVLIDLGTAYPAWSCSVSNFC